MPYREPDEDLARKRMERGAREQAELDGFVRDLRRSRRINLEAFATRVYRLPLGCLLPVSVFAGGVGGCTGVYLLDPAQGDGTAQLGTLLEAILFGFVGIIVCIAACIAFLHRRKKKYGS